MLNKRKNPYHIIKSRYVTEKSQVLLQLQTNSSNSCVKKCNAPKYVFLVDKTANKQEIAQAIETIYSGNKVKVVKVNTVLMKPKARRVRGRSGYRAGYKKAIVTLEPGDVIDDVK